MSILPVVAATAAGAFGAGLTAGAFVFSPRLIWRGSASTRPAETPTRPAPAIESPAPMAWATVLDPATGELTRTLVRLADLPQLQVGIGTPVPVVASDQVVPQVSQRRAPALPLPPLPPEVTR